jgi:hypothetical protein
MKDFKTYYKSKFREDLNRFFSTIPDESRFHEDNQGKQTFSIQYERLTPRFKHLDFLKKEEQEYFGVALFFTVLIDMVCFSHFKAFYIDFFKLTRYPKFIGNCPGGCLYHYNPGDIFTAMNYGRSFADSNRLDFFEKFDESLETMKIETINFFHDYLPEIDGDIFWTKCKNEFPYRLKTE